MPSFRYGDAESLQQRGMTNCLSAFESVLSHALAPLVHVRKRNDGRCERRLRLDLRGRMKWTRPECVENRFGAWLERRLGTILTGHSFDLARSIDARRDHGYPDSVAEIGVKGRAQDDVGFVVDLLADPAGGFV